MDREKVIKGKEHLDAIMEVATHLVYPDYVVVQEHCLALLAMLKEHDAVEPTLIREGRNKYYNDYVCPRCDNEVVYEQNYCSECGVRFLWEGR